MMDQKILKEINQLSRGLSNKSLKKERFYISGDTSSLEPTPRTGVVRHKINFTSEYVLVGEKHILYRQKHYSMLFLVTNPHS